MRSALPCSSRAQLPAGLLKPRGIAVELVYNPRVTPLIVQAKQKDCIVIEGIEILLEQAIEGNRVSSSDFFFSLLLLFCWNRVGDVRDLDTEGASQKGDGSCAAEAIRMAGSASLLYPISQLSCSQFLHATGVKL